MGVWILPGPVQHRVRKGKNDVKPFNPLHTSMWEKIFILFLNALSKPVISQIKLFLFVAAVNFTSLWLHKLIMSHPLGP